MTPLFIDKIHPNATLPVRATKHSACYDVAAFVDARFVVFVNSVTGTEERIGNVWIHPGERCLVPTGLKMCCDPGYRIAIYPRSGLSINKGISLINCVGVIDADYRDEVFITLVNHGERPYQIIHGQRIAQLAIEKVEPVVMVTGGLPATYSDRDGGFGSTDDKDVGNKTHNIDVDFTSDDKDAIDEKK